MNGRTGPELRIEMLGGCRISGPDGPVDESAWRLRKARGLVTLLALMPGHAPHREQVIDALWPDLDPAAGSNNLRQALFVARRALDSCGDDGAGRIELTSDKLQLATAGLSIDVEEFEAAAARAQRDPDIELLRAALELYRGELLPEYRFDEWALARRETLKEIHLGLLLTLAQMHVDGGSPENAVAPLQRALLADPLHEPAHRELMRIYALTGRRQRALGQFHLLREALRREFEDEPEEDTRRLYQDVLARRIGSDTPARAAPAPRRAGSATLRTGNLPLQLTSFIGRDRELREVTGLAHRHRLVTLTGPGGCGKTRLALEAATALMRETRGGVWLVELAGLSDGGLVAAAIAQALGVESRSSRTSQDAVIAHVGQRQMLLILDNCEHLVGACCRIAESLLRSCPDLRILATSREPLHAAGEVDWRVPSLAPPEAARLFIERAASASSRFAPSEENAEAIAEICRRVDGIPLAVELAAARVGVLAPAQIAQRLRESLSVLAAGRRNALTRQQTLTATLDWSHELLDGPERQLFRRLGIFAGTFDLPAVETVCEGELDVLGALVDKSLVVVEEHDGHARYLLLDTVRHYARGRLAAAGEREALETSHRAYYVKLAEELEFADAPARQQLKLEADELRWALRSALRSDPQAALRLAATLWPYWHDRGDRSEGAHWLEQALHSAPDSSPARAAALHGLSVIALRMSDHARALQTAHEAVTYFRGAGDLARLSEELHHVGTMSWVFADFGAAVSSCIEAHGLAESAGLAAVVASLLHTLGVIAASRRDTAAGREMIERSIAALRALEWDSAPLLLPVAHGYGHVPGSPHRRFLAQTFVTARRVRPAGAILYAQCDLAGAMDEMGDRAGARAVYQQTLEMFRELNDDLGAAQALCQLGNLISADGEHELARELHDESLALREAANDARGIGLSLLAIAVAASHAGDLARAQASVDDAIALFTRTDDGPGLAAATMQLGYLAADAGRVADAVAHQKQAFELWTKFIPSVVWNADILLELADLDVRIGDVEAAAEHRAQALALFERSDDRVGIALSRTALARPLNVPLTAG